MEKNEIEIKGKLYTEIDKKYFLRGMYCNSDVYGKILNQTPVLLCSKSIINERFSSRLHQMLERGTVLYVEKEAAKNLQEQYGYLSGVNEENVRKMIEIREQFGDVLNEVGKTNKLNVNAVLPMISSLDSTVKKVDLSFILHWTSYMRDVDKYLQSHSTNVAILNGKLAEWLGMTDRQVKKAIIIGLLHDLGKTKIPSEVLNKPGRLTEEEFKIIKLHPIYSWEILKASGVTDIEILSGARGHHEKINGTGYPDGLHMDQISTYAKLTGVADIYDAMVAQRVYKDSNTPFVVLDEFYRDKFAQLDLSIVNVFLTRMRSELIGKDVILSNGKIGTICYIEEGNFLYPMVKIEDQVVQLDKDLQCVTLCTKTGII